MPTQRRPITAREWRRLGEIGVLGTRMELLDGFIVHGRYPYAFSDEAVAAAREIGIELTEPVGEASPGGGQMDASAVQAVAELALRLACMMRPEVALMWLTSADEGLDGERPVDLIARGDIETVRRLVSGLEDPGAM